MKNLKLVLFFVGCFLFAGSQLASAQVEESIKDADAVKEEIKQENSQLNVDEDKRVYSTKATEAKAVENAAKIEGTLEKPAGVNGEATIKEVDSDILIEEEQDNIDDDKDDDDN